LKVFIPGPLRSYTGNRSEVQAAGGTVGEVLFDLDRQFPGIRFRMVDEQDRVRRHIRLYVNTEEAPALGKSCGASDEIQILCAISGG